MKCNVPFVLCLIYFVFLFLHSSLYADSNDMTCMHNFQPDLKIQTNQDVMKQDGEYDEEEALEEISKELEQFEDKPNPNLNETEPINLGDQEDVRETKISVRAFPQLKDGMIQVLIDYKDVFAWSYDDMPGLSTKLVAHKLPTDPAFPPVKQKLRKFKNDASIKIK